MTDKCKFCGEVIGLLSSHYQAQEQKRENGRWETVAICCEKCALGKELRTRTWRKKND